MLIILRAYRDVDLTFVMKYFFYFVVCLKTEFRCFTTVLVAIVLVPMGRVGLEVGGMETILP